MVYRCFTERRPGFDVEAKLLLEDLRETLGIEMESVRILNRYDLEGIDAETYAAARETVLSEPQTDDCYDEVMPSLGLSTLIPIEALPGQYDQRADSCAQCIQMMTFGERPRVVVAKIYAFQGSLSEGELLSLKKYLINPVDSREASLDKPETLAQRFEIPTAVETVEGFIRMGPEQLDGFLADFGLAMDGEDLRFLQQYFIEEGRDPTVPEIRVIDTYWSDHCRHTTFLTQIDRAVIEDKAVAEAYERYLEIRKEVYGDRIESRPITLMDLATIGAKVLKKRGLLQNLDESEEINACSVHIPVEVDGEVQDWLLMFKNETHNHPTEIEPFGGAATCLGGAIRDPLSGRSYVYQAMRVTGAGDPTVPLSDTLQGKLPQKKLTTTAAAGYSSYGNQIGLATGLVQEIYHPGYVAKRMEIGAVVGAVPSANVVRARPEEGDLVVLLGGATGRDGCGGATGSSKTHTADSITESAAEVQKGNPPEERKLQRLFRKPEVAHRIKRCNDFGAGGVSVAIGELADGLIIDLDKVPKKYEGLDATELAISESQERMAVVIAPEEEEIFIREAEEENLQATVVARVTADPVLVMRWNGQTVVELKRDFLNSNGAVKHTEVVVPAPSDAASAEAGSQGTLGRISDRLLALLSDLNVCSQRGLGERFDGSIGSGSVLMPYGGKYQRTPTQVMAALIPLEHGETETCSVMSFGFDPFVSSASPFRGAQMAVVDSVAKLVAAGCDYRQGYLTFQEYFERLRGEPQRWGKPFSALLGALDAQLGLGLAAIGGKDSMSGSFMELDVPPTLVSFAIAAEKASFVLSPEFKVAGAGVYAFEVPSYSDYPALKSQWAQVHSLIHSGKIRSAWAVGLGGAVEGLAKMAIGNRIGFKSAFSLGDDFFFGKRGPMILVESSEKLDCGRFIGRTTAECVLEICGEKTPLDQVLAALEQPLEKVFPMRMATGGVAATISGGKQAPIRRMTAYTKPLALVPVFPGTNCEYDTGRAIERAGGKAEILVLRNRTPHDLEQSVRRFVERAAHAQIIVLPGGFSGGDEPDGSAKFITSFFRNPAVMEETHRLLYERDGLMLGICNGFQALIKLGLLPFGQIRKMDAESPTLTHNLIGRHQSRYVRTRVTSVASPWLSLCHPGDTHAIAVSHGEGRFVAPEEVLCRLAESGQIAFQYVDLAGEPSMDIEFNPNGSMGAIEGILSPDGRILGKMGHTERGGPHVAKNLPFNKVQPIFEGGIRYFAD